MAPTSLEGQTLGRYRVLESLGRGGMARVYRAYHAQLNRYVAIKVMRSDLADDDSFLARFQREAQAVASLRHPNIIQVFDFDRDGETYFMVMELLEGDNLKNRIHDFRVRGQQMPWGEVIRIMLDALAGLEYAHQEGMIHRDIKPANIMLTKRGQAVLTDFGIAQIVGGTQYTATGVLMGTLEYMAPEQGLHNTCDAQSDIYSMGVVLYEICTQCVPFQADTPLAILMKHVNDPLPLPCSLNPDIPPALEQVILKAMSKQPNDRFPNAAAMVHAIENAATQAGIDVAERVSPPISFSTDEAPSESVAVISGNSRQHITESGFAEGETAVTEHLLQQEPESKPKRRRSRDEQNKPKAEAATQPQERTPVGKAIMVALALLLGGNFLAVTYATLTRQWAIYTTGWPFVLFLLASGLFYIMYVCNSIWMLIPAGIVFGNAVLFSYSSLTGNWEHWSMIWILEPWLIGISILLPALVSNHEEHKHMIIHWGALILGGASIAASVLVPGAAAGIAIIQSILAFFTKG